MMADGANCSHGSSEPRAMAGLSLQETPDPPRASAKQRGLNRGKWADNNDPGRSTFLVLGNKGIKVLLNTHFQYGTGSANSDSPWLSRPQPSLPVFQPAPCFLFTLFYLLKETVVSR